MAISTIGTNGLASGGVTPTQLNTQAQYTGFKNRIINGAMMIDQRNSGAASASPPAGSGYLVDRFIYSSSAV